MHWLFNNIIFCICMFLCHTWYIRVVIFGMYLNVILKYHNIAAHPLSWTPAHTCSNTPCRINSLSCTFSTSTPHTLSPSPSISCWRWWLCSTKNKVLWCALRDSTKLTSTGRSRALRHLLGCSKLLLKNFGEHAGWQTTFGAKGWVWCGFQPKCVRIH